MNSTAIPELHFRRASQQSEPTYTINMPSLYIIVQGSKTATLVGETYHYDSASYMVSSVHLPVIGRITNASTQLPYLSLQLILHPDVLLDIVNRSNQKKSLKTGRGIMVNQSTPTMLEAVIRLVKLLDCPADIPMLAPLYIREIFYRVLQSEQGMLLQQFAVIGSYAQGISKAIQHINRDYSKPLIINELAKEVNMSVTSLHKHFKRVTGLSPLQYHKTIRLQTARRLLLTEGFSAANAGFSVGYESPSQFNREYARLFGLPPISDIKHLRDSVYELN
ncbi:AraC family transcriptional regulator N-terminal domain-containing protein [Paenibacillus xylanilyticus]|uniref:AraC family transcriptional regulator N-terminal domain-containing protein n=1 Tax=Paenibacillus xylanilyticus TaxID=248903 RepID=UPI0039A061A8